jgi:glycosyltransferase involved in cell wall biosynthesis
MLIGIDASRAIKQHKTGVEWYAYHVIEDLVKIDTANQFVLYCDKTPDAWLKKIGERPNVKIKRLGWPLKYFWTQGRLSLEMLLRAPDILFISASAMPVIHPENTVVAIHDVGFMAYPQSYGHWQRWYQKFSTRFTVKYAAKIITISEFSQREIIKYFKADERKISVTYLGYDKERFNGDVETRHASSLRKKYDITPPYFLFVGRLEHKKNILGLIKAFSLLSHEVQLVLAGSPGYGWLEAEKIIKEKNLQSDIVVTGYVPEADLPALYRGATALVFPSFYEGFGLPILEAFASGTPVICSNAASLPEVAGAAALYVEPNNIKALADAMTQVLTHETLRRELTYKGREQVERFLWEKCGRELAEVFTEMAKKQKNKKTNQV